MLNAGWSNHCNNNNKYSMVVFIVGENPVISHLVVLDTEP